MSPRRWPMPSSSPQARAVAWTASTSSRPTSVVGRCWPGRSPRCAPAASVRRRDRGDRPGPGGGGSRPRPGSGRSVHGWSRAAPDGRTPWPQASGRRPRRWCWCMTVLVRWGPRGSSTRSRPPRGGRCGHPGAGGDQFAQAPGGGPDRRGPPRDGMSRAQTPQGARRTLLLAAIDAYAEGPEVFGDEAELLGRTGALVTAMAGRWEEPQGDAAGGPGAGAARSPRVRSPRPSLRGREATAIPSGRTTGFGWAASRPRKRHGCGAIRTVTPRSTPSATRCSRRRAWATWGARFRPATRPPAASTAGTLLAQRRGAAGRRRVRAGLGRPHRSPPRAPASGARDSTGCARSIAGLTRPADGRGLRQGRDRQPGRVRRAPAGAISATALAGVVTR